ncbi:MAG: hypothetical protein KGJ84_04670 [Elusimicrobia bacterium]|nr:hypothetical protein [Elusimicrobiota bacterium]
MILLLLLLAANPAAAQASPVPVAGSVVRSKEWVVRRGKIKEEEFIGDVRYESAGARLSADWALYRHEPDDWRARGHIRARKEYPNGDVLETAGETAAYEQRTRRGVLEPAKGGRVSLLRTTALRAPEHGEGDRLSWTGDSEFRLTGKARGWGPSGEFWADDAAYGADPSRRLTLTGGRPLLHAYDDGADAALQADRISGADGPRRAEADGRVAGWLLAQSTASSAGDPPRCLRGTRDGSPGPDARVSERLAAGDEAGFWAAEEVAFASRACPWGPRAEFWADRARYEEDRGQRLTLTGGQAALRKRDDDWSTALKADRFVATNSPRRVVADGKVRGWLQFKDEKKYERSLK